METANQPAFSDSLRLTPKAVAALLGVFLLGLTLIILSPTLGFFYLAVVTGVWLISLFFPLSRIFLDRKSTRIILMLCLIVLSQILYFSNSITPQQNDPDAENRQRLIELRQHNPDAYLAELKQQGSVDYDEELRSLRPEIYAATVNERRQLEIQKLKGKLQASGLSDEENLEVYKRLDRLEPNFKEYTNQIARLAQIIAIKDLKQAELERQRKSPEHFVKLNKLTWTITGFGTVMEVGFSIKNELPWAIKDIVIHCDLYAASGTKIDENTRTLYERIEPSKSKAVREFGMGFVHSQSARASCQVAGVVVIR